MTLFNKIHLAGEEINYMNHAMQSGKIAGDGPYTKACENFFEEKFGFKKTLLTSSCTHALELIALLIDIKPGDEVIMPTYSFVSMANAFILRGAKIVFADSGVLNPNISVENVKALITQATKAIVVIHYGGIACDIIALKKLTDLHQIYLIEDAAHAVDSFYKGAPLGSFGHFATFSFHETKNITCGEGGLLVINDDKFIKRAEVIREKGTNRSSFIRKEIGRYSWVDVGSSFLTSDISAAFLYAQLNKLNAVTKKRKEIWDHYYNGLEQLAEKDLIQLPHVPNESEHNAHVFYIIFKLPQARTAYIDYMLLNNVQTQFHYVTLHNSPFYKQTHGSASLPMAEFYQDNLVRLPLFYDLKQEEINQIVDLTWGFFKKTKTDTPDRLTP